MSEEKTSGRVSYEARQAAKGRRMGADDDTPDAEIIAVIGLGWDELPAGIQADEEAGARAVLYHRTPQAEACRAALERLASDDWLGTQGYSEDELQRRVEFAQDKLAATTAQTAPPGEPLTHFFHCWRFPAHHACAVALIERQGEENDRLIVKAAGIPEPGHLAVMRGTIALRDAEIELLNARVAELAEALGEAAGHVEPLDQNSELAVGRWLELAKRYRAPRPGGTDGD